MPVDIIVSGRTTTVRDVGVVRAGDEIPNTFSATRVSNTPGFAWWVSRHYALKTDCQEGDARFYLTLLEMVYPHYVELFGRELPEIGEKRMAVCYASSAEQLRKALASDSIRWDFGGGGITFEGFKCAFAYPSGSLKYHQRYILLHECAHLYQMCLNGTDYTIPECFIEGMADLVANHVYDTAGRRLTVNVFDKPTTHDYLDEGLADLRRKPLTARQIHDQGGLARGIYFLLAHYLMDDPDRLQKFRIYRDEMFRLGLQHHRAESDRLMQDLFGPWEKIDADFRAWTASVRNTFHYAEWGWEQDADTLWSYGFAKGGRLSQTDVYLPPGEKPAYRPFRMDYPLQAPPALVERVERGTAEPSVGCVVDFSRNPGKGRAGIGLGLVGTTEIGPMPADILFADEAGAKPGVKATAFRTEKIAGDGLKPEDVVNGPRLGQSTDAGLGLGLHSSITQGLMNDFVVEWDAWLKAPKQDIYTFSTTSDDGSWLWIDGALVVDNGGKHNSTEAIGSVRLAAGMHRLRARYFQAGGPHAFEAGLMVGRRPGCLKVLIEEGANLVLDATDLGAQRKTVPMPADFRGAMAAAGSRAGMTVRIGRSELTVTLRAGDAEAPAQFKAALALTEADRARLLARPLAILARDGWHGVTPIFDDRRRPEPDLNLAAPPNRWRNPGDRQLAALYRAAWRLRDSAPGSLTSLRSTMLAAADKPPAEQHAALAAFEKSVEAVVKDIEQCPAPAEAKTQAIADLKAQAGKPAN
jgi:hypothetical protein